MSWAVGESVGETAILTLNLIVLVGVDGSETTAGTWRCTHTGNSIELLQLELEFETFEVGLEWVNGYSAVDLLSEDIEFFERVRLREDLASPGVEGLC